MCVHCLSHCWHTLNSTDTFYRRRHRLWNFLCGLALVSTFVLRYFPLNVKQTIYFQLINAVFENTCGITWRWNEIAHSPSVMFVSKKEKLKSVSSKDQMECFSLFLFISQPSWDWNNRILRVPKGRKLMLTSDLLIPSIIPAPGFKILANGMVLLMFLLAVPWPQRCILFKQEICPFSIEINTTGDEPPASSFLMKPLRPWLSWHVGQGRQT